jgi:hypothetical protein
MTEQTELSGSPFLRAIGGFFRILVRLAFVLVIGALIGLGLYYGVPWVYRRLVWPVQDNRARVAILEQRMDLEHERVQEKDRVLQERIVELETELTQLSEDAAVQAQDQQGLEERAQGLEGRTIQIAEALAAQQQRTEEAQAELEGVTTELDEEIEGLQERLGNAIADLEQRSRESQGRLDGLTALLNDLDGRLTLHQTAQDLLQVRLLLVEENVGAARDALALTVAHLDRAAELMPPQADTLEGLRNRTVALDGLIAADSFRVRPDLEALWADVMDLAVPLTPTSVTTATQTTSPLPAPTPSQ